MFISDAEIEAEGLIMRNCRLYKGDEALYYVLSGEISGMNVERIEVTSDVGEIGHKKRNDKETI